MTCAIICQFCLLFPDLYFDMKMTAFQKNNNQHHQLHFFNPLIGCTVFKQMQNDVCLELATSAQFKFQLFTISELRIIMFICEYFQTNGTLIIFGGTRADQDYFLSSTSKCTIFFHYFQGCNLNCGYFSTVKKLFKHYLFKLLSSNYFLTSNLNILFPNLFYYLRKRGNCNPIL